jgi:CRISPR-associated protein (Cas_Csd1)
MLQHLSSLRESAVRFSPVYHPWVRNMSKQDRWVIRVAHNGDPISAVFVAAVDAKHFVTVAKDNHNQFPSFKGRSLPMAFARELLAICTDGPMSGLLSSVSKIADSDGWWSAVDRLIQTAHVEDKYRQVEDFALDVNEGDSAIAASMRSNLSQTLFEWEATCGVGEYEIDTAPRPNLQFLGLCYLISRNRDNPSFARYGLEGLASYPVHRQTARETAACLEWITRDERRGRTWQSVPGRDADSRDLLVIHVSGAPDVEVRLADFFGDIEEPDDEKEAFYTALCESVTRFFAGSKVTQRTQGELLELMLIRKISPGVTRVETHYQPTLAQVKEVVSDWQTALDNVPFSVCPTRYMTPGQVTRTLRRKWICGGERSLDARWELADTYHIMFSRSPAQSMVKAAYDCGKNLLLASGRKNYRADHLATVGLSLWYAGQSKEKIVENVAFRLGRFLQMADLLHRQYCEQERDGSIPRQLVGNAYFDACSQSPTKALATIQNRLKLYQGFAQTRGNGLAKWALGQLGEISAEIAPLLPARLSTEEKAQMLLGYLARTPSADTNTGTSAKSEDATAATT